ncbi:hypothetical protein P775_21525 [Puniceibacterium antarcticum]|uniref:DUF1127 domain-containing protein n=1 Tax=Puniceibacterium antarcticum TaxID=1206336 RepID=A0A2G8R8Y1_9RHOB|nr:DUF1127 domain-containing protein [Puniceibacterium antarcticum]PIL18004.1 hypothetical protein P775_21525 [Puniceibacterium antarcticum]
MAHAISYTDTYPKAPLFTRIAHGLATWIDSYAENQPRMRGVRALQAMSDAQLAERGLKREDIVRHVFRGIY